MKYQTAGTGTKLRKLSRLPAAAPAGRRQPPGRGAEQRQTDRDVDEEDPPPGQARGHQAAQHGTDRTAADGNAGPDRQRPVAALARREGRGEDAQRGRGQDSGAGALDQPGGDQHPRRGRQPAGEAGQREDGQRGQEDSAAAEHVRGPAAEQEQPAEGQRVAVDDPFQPARAEAQAGPDAPDAGAALDAWAAHLADYHPRLLAVDRAVEQARHRDPDAAGHRRRVVAEKLRTCRRLAVRLDEEGQLAEAWTVGSATDMLFALVSSDLMEALMVDRRWSRSRLTTHLAALFRGTFLRPAEEAAR